VLEQQASARWVRKYAWYVCVLASEYLHCVVLVMLRCAMFGDAEVCNVVAEENNFAHH
jgi:hypothetical protein